MKRTFKTVAIASFFMLAFAVAAQAGGEIIPLTDKSSPEFQRIKALEGKWVSRTDMFGKKNQKVYTLYEVVSGGSAVLEKFAPGTPMEMVSVYYEDNGKLAMTNYCIMRNRPTLKLASSTADSISMDVKKIEGLKSKNDPSMGAMTLHFKDTHHFSATCKPRGKGMKKEKPHTMEYTRVK